MKRVKVFIENIPGSPYSQSARVMEPMKDRESHEAFDERTWRLKCTVNDDGVVSIPAMGLKQALDNAAYKLGVKVPGRRSNFRGFFESGVMCEANAPIHNGKPLKPEDAILTIINANADGKRGSGKRVLRRFPTFNNYQAEPTFIITDDIVSKEIFETHMKSAGIICGIGRFRPEKGGVNGRFKVLKFVWEEFNV